MRIIVISDTHGNYNAIESVFMRNKDADWFFHLGDGENELDRFIITHMDMSQKIIHVAGNCDYDSLSPTTFILPVPGHRIFAAHGHRLAVKNDLSLLKKAALENECDIAIFGHTHVPYNQYDDGMYLFNPGTAATAVGGVKSTFGCIDISDDGVLLNVAPV